MTTEIISKEEARSFLIQYHNLNNSQNYCGKEGILSYFSKVGSVQYDPLNVVGRNADLVLQSKISDYKPELLQELLYKGRDLLDGWDKEMCIYLSADYSRFERIRQTRADLIKYTLEYRGQLAALDILDEVRNSIKSRGALSSKDLSIGEVRKERWGPKKLSSASLDYLYTKGELSIVNKSGTQKLYDFTENVFHKDITEPFPFQDDDDFLSWYVKRRIGSVGMLWDRRGGAWQGYYLSDKTLREKKLNQLLEEGSILRFQVEDLIPYFYVRKEDLSHFQYSSRNTVAKFLAPLDNFLWDRDMISKLFGFDYSWEVYLPVTKRKYGYYVLPVLYGNQLIARFEPNQTRKGTEFTIKNWWWEKDVEVTETMKEAIHIAVKDFCSYLEAENNFDPSLL
ncbi:MAG: winged helix DNA-binding domain-containing protein [Mobilitalea sp.]